MLIDQLMKPFKKFKTLPTEAVILKNADPEEDEQKEENQAEQDDSDDEQPGIGDS